MEAKPGQYEAHLVDYGIGVNSKQNPQIILRLAWEDADKEQHIRNYYAQLNEGQTRDITMATLRSLGLDESKHSLEALIDGPASNVLDMQRKVQVTVKSTVGKDGKTYLNISSVGKSANLQDNKDEARAALARFGLGGKASTAAPAAAPIPTDDVPF
jgi:hypothetical protein